jgi:hypothetical protein
VNPASSNGKLPRQIDRSKLDFGVTLGVGEGEHSETTMAVIRSHWQCHGEKNGPPVLQHDQAVRFLTGAGGFEPPTS